MRCFTRSHGGIGDRRDALRAFAQNAGQVAGLGGDFAVALLERLQLRDHHLGHLLFQIAVAHAGEVRAASASSVRSEKAWKMVSRLSTPGPGGLEIHGGVGIGGGAHDGLADLVRRIEQRHRVAGAGGRFAHLLRWDRRGP